MKKIVSVITMLCVLTYSCKKSETINLNNLQESSIKEDDLANKIWVGYQAWHRVAGEGSVGNNWKHWFHFDKSVSVSNFADQWPAAWNEYAKLYDTGLFYPDGSSVKVYSSYDYETIDLHVKWMRDYGIEGFFLQRQQKIVHLEKEKDFRNTVLRHVMTACYKYGVKFAIMPCFNVKSSTADLNQILQNFKTDWDYLVKDMQLTQHEMYAYKNGKPVVCFWGLGVSERPISPKQASNIIDYFQNGPVKSYVIGGVIRDFTTKSPNATLGYSKEEWFQTYEKLDMIQPWRSARNPSTDRINKLWCESRNIDYMSVLYAGASSFATKGVQVNGTPRIGGAFYWDQFYNLMTGTFDIDDDKHIYVAMFDETDEGTAIYKAANQLSDLPNPARQIHYNLAQDTANPYFPTYLKKDTLAEDWYLQLTKKMSDLLRINSIPGKEIPIRP